METGKVGSYSVYKAYVKYVINKQEADDYGSY